MPRLRKERGYVGRFTGKEYRSARGLGDYRWEPRPGQWASVILPVIVKLLVDLEEYLPLRPRAILYRLMGKKITDDKGNVIRVTKEDNERLIDLLTMARRGGQIAWEDIDDGRTVSHEREGYAHPQDYLEATIDHAIDNYLRKLRQGQEWFIELWVESAGYLPVLQRTCDEYGVKLISGSGFNPVLSIRDSALEAIERYRRTEQRTLLVFLGDRDDSGITRIERTDADIRQFFIDHRGESATCEFVIKSIWLGLTPNQAADLGLSEHPDKPGAFELEAVEPSVVIGWVRRAFEQHTDMDVLAETIAISEIESKRLAAAFQRLMKRWK